MMTKITILTAPANSQLSSKTPIPILKALIYKGGSGSVCDLPRDSKSQGILLNEKEKLMHSSNFMEPPNFDLPPAIAVLPTPELRLLMLIYMGHKGIMPDRTPIKVSDRLCSASQK